MHFFRYCAQSCRPTSFRFRVQRKGVLQVQAIGGSWVGYCGGDEVTNTFHGITPGIYGTFHDEKVKYTYALNVQLKLHVYSESIFIAQNCRNTIPKT